MYTERYMGLPTYEDNLIGYENGSLLDKVDKIKGKRFQVNHGVADDNVSKQRLLQRICYSHWANGDRNGVISIGQWGMFNHENGAI